MKVLIVDDNANDRELLRINLERHGCEVVIEACNGQEGFDLTKAQRPDLIVSDAMMPILDGYDFLRLVKMDEDLKLIPFVFYSSVYTGQKDEELATRLGAEAFIPKPKEPEEFWQKISVILQRVAAGRVKIPSSEPINEEGEYLREYSGVVTAKLAEKVRELEESLARLRKGEEELLKLSAAIEQSPVTIVITDIRGTIEFVNPKFTQMTGYSSEEAIGLNPRIMKSGETSPAEYKKLWATIRSGNVWRGEFHNRKKNGELFWEYATIAPVQNREGAITHFIAIKEDITERRELEAQLRQSQKMEAIGLLAGGIAHDFNNMLMAIIGYGSILQMKIKGDDPLRSNVEKMLAAADRAAGLTKSLLTFSRKQEIHLQPVNLNAIIRKAESFLARVIGENIKLQMIFREDPLNVNADSGQIEQVLMNLTTNARDAMPNGGTLLIRTGAVEIGQEYIKAHGYGEAGSYVLVSVTDNGAGMDEATVERLFEPFFTTKEVGKGTGLGLPIVYGIIKQHGGYIDVSSTPGSGTTFQLYLPLLKNGEVVEDMNFPPPLLHDETETILLAEDEAEIRKLEKEVLTEFGYTVIEAVDGEDAVSKFREHRDRINLLLFDLIMPNKSGKEAYDEIRALGSEVRAIFISGYPPDVVRENNNLAEEVELIMKPVSPQNLLRKIREVLDK